MQMGQHVQAWTQEGHPGRDYRQLALLGLGRLAVESDDVTSSELGNVCQELVLSLCVRSCVGHNLDLDTYILKFTK